LEDLVLNPNLIDTWNNDDGKPISMIEGVRWLESHQKVVDRSDVLSKIQWKWQCEHIHKYSNCVTLAEIQLQGDPTNEGAQKILAKSQVQLTKVFQANLN
jgi:hypothetical protein